MVQYHLLDQERISKDNFGGQIGVGYNLLHGFAVEADANRANFSISGLTAEQRLTGYSLDVIKKFFEGDTPGWYYRRGRSCDTPPGNARYDLQLDRSGADDWLAINETRHANSP